MASNPGPRRPRSVTWLSLAVFILGLLQWTRAFTLAVRLDLLARLPLTIPLPYAIGSAAVWGGLLAAAAFGLWRMRSWGRWLALGAVTASLAQGWLDRLLFERSDYSRLSTGFGLAVTGITLALTWLVLWRRRF